MGKDNSEQIKNIEQEAKEKYPVLENRQAEYENFSMRSAYIEGRLVSVKVIEEKDFEIAGLQAERDAEKFARLDITEQKDKRIAELEDGLRKAKEDDGFGWLHSSTKEKIEQLLTK